MYFDERNERVVPEEHRIGWKFCLFPTLHHGRTIWLRSIPVLQRLVKYSSCGMSWQEWVTVGVLDDISLQKPLPIDDYE